MTHFVQVFPMIAWSEQHIQLYYQLNHLVLSDPQGSQDLDTIMDIAVRKNDIEDLKGRLEGALSPLAIAIETVIKQTATSKKDRLELWNSFKTKVESALRDGSDENHNKDNSSVLMNCKRYVKGKQ